MQAKRTSGFSTSKSGFFAFLIGASLIGVLLGTVAYCYMSEDFLRQISLAQNNFLEIRHNSDFAVVLMKSLSSATMFLGAVFILGLSAISQPLEIAVLVVRGMGYGVTMAQVYSQNGSSGILTCALLIVPAAVVSTYALAIGTREAVLMSNLLMTNSLSDRGADGMLTRIKLYGVKFLVLEAVMAVSAAVDCLCTVLFIGII